MGDTYLVDIDLDRLRHHRSRVERRDLSDADVRKWLISSGLYPRQDGTYLCEEQVLRQLAPDEVITARPMGYLLH